MKINSIQRYGRILGVWCLGILCFSIILISQPSVSYSLTPSEVPNPQEVYGGWVTDMANVLSNETEDRLNQMIFELEEKNGTEIAVVTVPETGSYPSPKAFTTALFNHWGIGKQGQDNGLLFLTSVGDRRVEIETGYGIERVLPDARVGRILDNHVVPYLRNDNFNDGILAGTQALIQAVEYQVFDSSLQPPIDIPNLVWFLTGSAGLLSCTFYNLASREAQKPILVKPGDYQRITTFDPSETGAYTYVRLGIFCVLFALTAIPVLWMLYRTPQLAPFSGVFSVALIAILFINLVGKAYKKAYKTILVSMTKINRPTKIHQPTKIYQLIIMAFCVGILSIGFFFWLIFGLIFWLIGWLISYQESWIGIIKSGIIITSLISLIGCFTISSQLIEWRFKKNKNQRSFRPVYNTDSQVFLEPLETAELQPLLTDHEQVAAKLGNVSFEAWWSPEVGALSRDTIYLKAYVNKPSHSECPIGKELTVTSTSQTVVSPTQYSTGLLRITYQCECCNYNTKTDHTIPSLSSSSSSGGSSGSGGGSFGGGSSSSGGSFGGGSSGGGGGGSDF